jgi:hypothetical protein
VGHGHCPHRPHLLACYKCVDLRISGLRFLNSPNFNVKVVALRAEIDHIGIMTDRSPSDRQRLYTTITDRRRQSQLASDPPSHTPVATGGASSSFTSVSSPFSTAAAAAAAAADDLADSNLLSPLAFQPEDLNTDGIDPAGKDIFIHDCTIVNDDDSIAVKPTDSKSGFLPEITCTENIRIENMVRRTRSSEVAK